MPKVVAALAAARELPQLSLEDALELTLLVARKDPRRHPRVAVRWLRRYSEEDPKATIEEAALAASALIALTGAGYREAAQTLKGHGRNGHLGDGGNEALREHVSACGSCAHRSHEQRLLPCG